MGLSSFRAAIRLWPNKSVSSFTPPVTTWSWFAFIIGDYLGSSKHGWRADVQWAAEMGRKRLFPVAAITFLNGDGEGTWAFIVTTNTCMWQELGGGRICLLCCQLRVRLPAANANSGCFKSDCVKVLEVEGTCFFRARAVTWKEAAKALPTQAADDM